MLDHVEEDDLSVESLLGQAANEYSDRLSRGESPQIEEYTSRYPQIAQLIEEVFPALNILKDGPSEPGGDAAESVNPKAQECLGDFRIVGEIGRGGMGIVYEAIQVSLGRTVALKVLPFAAMLDNKQLTRFKNEARAAATLDHPNIVPVHAVGSERGVHFYAMQLIEGQSMAEVIEDLKSLKSESSAVSTGAGENPPQQPSVGSLAPSSSRTSSNDPTIDGAGPNQRDSSHSPPTNALTSTTKAALTSNQENFDHSFFRSVAELGVQAGEALHHAHEQGIVHRDIKPANLMMDAAGKLFITDFGLAQVEGDGGLTMTGDLLGTIRYMAPEQALGKRVVLDHRADIYSLGTTLYELLTLRPAFDGDDRQSVLHQIAFEEPTPPRKVDNAIPPELDTILLKSIEKNPDQRYSTAKDLADDLQRFIDSKPILAKPPTLVDRAAKWSQRNPVITWSAIILTMVIAVGSSVATWLVYQEKARTGAALTTATQNQVRAERSYQVATHTINRMLVRVADDRLRRIPQLRDVREELLTEAVDLYSKLLELDPNDSSLYLQRARAHHGLLAGELALADFHRSIDLNPNNHDAHFAIARFFNSTPITRMRDYRKALQHVQTALQVEPKSMEYQLLRAAIIGDRFSYQDGLGHFEEALRLDPGNADAYFTRAMVASKRRQPQHALLDIDRALQLGSASGSHPIDPRHRPYQIKADALAELNRFEEALASYAMAETRDPYNHYVYVGRGDVFLKMGKYEDAVENFTVAIKVAPDWPSYKRRALANFHLRRYADALSDVEKSIEVAPHDASVITWIQPRLVAQCTDKVFTNGLVKLAGRLIAKTPNKSDAYVRRAQLRLALEHIDKAEMDLCKAMEINPNNNWYGAYFLAMIRLASGDVTEYREICSTTVKSVETTEDHFVAHFVAWTCCLAPDGLHDWNAGIKLAESAAEGKPEYEATLGALLYRAGRVPEAIELLQRRAIAMSDSNSSAASTWFMLAMASHKVGDAEQAQGWFDKANSWSDQQLQKPEELSWTHRLTLKLLSDEATDLLTDVSASQSTGHSR